MTTLIALIGKAGAGKDSTADVLVAHARFCRLAFADALRVEVAIAFDLTQHQTILTDRATKERPHDALALRNCKSFCFIGAIAMAQHACVNSEWLDTPRSPRQILQWWGTEYRRAEDDLYWVKAMDSRIKVREQGGVDRFVITDCRYINEAKSLTGRRLRLWRIERPGLPDVEGGHTSSTEWLRLDPHIVLNNAGDMAALRSEALRHWWALDSGLQAEQLHVEVAPCQ